MLLNADKTDLELVAKVVKKDNDALQELTRRYMPMINNIKSRYYIRHYDHDDWNQDAMLICYEACCLFDQKKNSNFGAFFKTKLSNHARSLIRYEMAKQREPYTNAVSYEAINAAGMVNEESVELSVTPMREIFDKYVKDLSQLELATLLFLLGNLSQEKVYQQAKCDHYQLLQARSRCKNKLTKQLKKHSE